MVSQRIKMIASLISKDEKVVDVGCDHAYLALNLRDNGHKEIIYCVDNKVGPLNSAKQTIDEYQLKNCVTILSNGLEKVDGEFDVVVMAGMGYHNVISIINERVKKAIIQVNTDVDKMRKWLVNNGFKIIDELVIYDHKYYEILVVEKGKQILNDIEETCGPINIKKNDKVFRDYLTYRINKFRTILSDLSKENEDYQEIEKKIKQLENV